MTPTRHKIPATRGKAARVDKGQTIKIINDTGSQVVDTWAFNAHDLKEVMSMEHTRAENLHIIPQVGDSFLSNKRRALLTILEGLHLYLKVMSGKAERKYMNMELLQDTCGVHDTLISSCDEYRYKILGCDGYHRSCTDNLREGLADINLELPEVPSPLNLWMNVPWDSNKGAGKLRYAAPASKPGDYISLRAEVDVIIVFSACPNDKLEVNGVIGPDGIFRASMHDCHYEIIP